MNYRINYSYAYFMKNRNINHSYTYFMHIFSRVNLFTICQIMCDVHKYLAQFLATYLMFLMTAKMNKYINDAHAYFMHAFMKNKSWYPLRSITPESYPHFRFHSSVYRSLKQSFRKKANSIIPYKYG